MQKPKVFKKENFSIYTGREIIWRFYERGYLKVNYIPKELDDKNWKPWERCLYKVWWHSTNPSDPSDPGDDVLDYIEECPYKYIHDLVEDINNKLFFTKDFNLVLDIARKLRIDIQDEPINE